VVERVQVGRDRFAVGPLGGEQVLQALGGDRRPAAF
jgi:hypothetical protein